MWSICNQQIPFCIEKKIAKMYYSHHNSFLSLLDYQPLSIFYIETSNFHILMAIMWPRHNCNNFVKSSNMARIRVGVSWPWYLWNYVFSKYCSLKYSMVWVWLSEILEDNIYHLYKILTSVTKSWHRRICALHIGRMHWCIRNYMWNTTSCGHVAFCLLLDLNIDKL